MPKQSVTAMHKSHPTESSAPLTEVILSHPQTVLGNVHLEGMPQPGAHINLQGKTYLVLERHHRYQYKAGRYRLSRIRLYVQLVQDVAEKSLVNGRWVLGDITCRYNARSELVRCAVNPSGSCSQCRFYEPIAGHSYAAEKSQRG
ncbi:MAG: DUF6464 family protein [Cyanobacteria bacterium]|nr:DUF6464 family protein [Cyanobacteriota bacterium]MDW8203107.1 DUF6464 family protein [Cyanobacteriota bacterium SKYGB_h_bin112]